MDEENQMINQIRSSITQTQSLISKLRLEEQQLISQLSTTLQQTQTFKSKQQKQYDKQKQTINSKTIDNNQNNNNTQQQSKIQKQLEKELQNSQTKLKQLQHQLKQQQKKKPKNQLQSLNQLFEIETQIKITEADIKCVNQEIRGLNNIKKKQQKTLINKQSTLNAESQKMSKMIDELYLLRSTLDKLKVLSQKKKQDVLTKKQQVKSIQSKYLTMCEKNGDKPVTFQDFKAMMKNKLKSVSEADKTSKKQYVSIRELIKSKETYEHVQPTKQNLLELRNKKEIANHALKNAKKKHEVELRELKRKLESVKEQNSELQHKLEQKEKQRNQVGVLNNTNKKGRITPMI